MEPMKYYVFHNMVQHLNGFKFKYSRIFMHQLIMKLIKMDWNQHIQELSCTIEVLSIMHCTIWCNILMASNPNISYIFSLSILSEDFWSCLSSNGDDLMRYWH